MADSTELYGGTYITSFNGQDGTALDLSGWNLKMTPQTYTATGDSYDYYTLCQYSECPSLSEVPCKFPFKYKNRMYDTCITIDGNGESWCSIGVDQNFNHLAGNDAVCSESCRTVDCPIGYYWMQPADSCYKV